MKQNVVLLGSSSGVAQDGRAAVHPPQPEVFVAEAGDDKVQVVAMSALLTTSLPWLEKTIRAMDKEGVRNRVKVLVGGAVLDKDKALAAGADGYAPDAARAVDKCKELLGLATNSPRE